MKQYVYLFLFLLSTNMFAQNVPAVTVKNAQDLKLTDLKVSVEIVGNLAVTTYDMKFYNGLDRTLEGELVFPLGEGQTVSGFAMDVNGNMRDAVIVEKELGRVAYETTIRRKIDPGLLEKTEGNNYRARVYPLLSKSNKHIIVKFEQELSTLDGKQSYELPLGISQSLDAFSVEMNVFNEQQPIVAKARYKNFFFQKKGEAFVAKTSKNNHAPTQPIVIQIPNKTNKENLATYNGHFHYYKALQPKTRLKKKPKKITILWDASYSMNYKDLDIELKVLLSYLEYVRNVKVDFIAFNNAIQTQKELIVENGNVEAVLEAIKNVQYDGGTKLNILENVRIKADEILLFSDGLANLGDFVIKRKIPIYAINSLVSANHQHLTDITTQSGGSYLNLLRLDFAKATQLLKMETYQFLGVIHDEDVREIYPRQRVNVYQDFSISGQFSGDAEIELLFGYSGRVTQKIPVTIEDVNGTKAVKRLWAKQKLEDLYRDKDANEEKITSLAKKYSLITDYTSMIILDRIEDYVRYKIEPPKELIEDYKRHLEVAKNEEILRKKRVLNRRNELFDGYKTVLDWYQSKIVLEEEKKPEPIVEEQTTSTTQQEQQQVVATETGTATTHTETATNATTQTTVQIDQGVGELITITGTIIDDEGMPLPGANVTVKHSNRGAITDFDGNYSIQAKMRQQLVITYVGYGTVEKEIASQTINVEMKAGESLEAITVVGYGGSVSSAKMSSAISTVSSEYVGQYGNPSDEMRKTIEAIEMLIRSSNSLSENNKPLFFINGKISNQRSFRKIQEEEIAQLGILKNQEATAIFGTKARGGAVYIVTKKGIAEDSDAIDAFNEKMASRIKMKSWNSDMPYIKELEKETTVADAYKKYIEIRAMYVTVPSFYLDVADFFHSRQATETAITIITNLMEIELDNYELLKAAAYKFEYFKRYKLAVLAYEKVLELRPEEPQSYRDLALAYEQVGDIQKSYDLLNKLCDGELLQKDEEERFTGIEHIAYVELTRLVNTYKKKLKLKKKVRKTFTKMPVDVRIVIDWNHNDTDIDLWVYDPKGEKASYKNMHTKIGGRMSEDLTEGYGPEEFMLKDAVKGEYKIVVDHYSSSEQKVSGPTILKVALYTNYGKENEEKKTAVIRLSEKSDELEVGSLVFE